MNASDVPSAGMHICFRSNANRWDISCIGSYGICIQRGEELTKTLPAECVMIVQVIAVAQPAPRWDTVAERRLNDGT